MGLILPPIQTSFLRLNKKELPFFHKPNASVRPAVNLTDFQMYDLAEKFLEKILRETSCHVLRTSPLLCLPTSVVLELCQVLD